MIKKNTTCRLGENMAAKYLRTKGYYILRRNYRVRGGEIDIIAKQNQTLVFVEVKTRRQNAGGYPEEAVTPKKLKRMDLAIQNYLMQKRQPPKEMRIDVISIELDKLPLPRIHHLKNITLEQTCSF